MSDIAMETKEIEDASNSSIDNSIEQEYSAIGQSAGVETEPEPEHKPYDPSLVKISNKQLSIETLLRRLRQGTVNLAPVYQRRGGLWDAYARGRLIESLLLRIPLPMFYIAADEMDTWHIVDGLQRCTAFRDFILADEPELSPNPKYSRLSGLEFWQNDLDGKTFQQLHSAQQNRILETQLHFTVIEPDTPEEVKRNIFKRINTGGLPLTPQEIRHALYQGVITKSLERLAESGAFTEAVTGSIRDQRMAARELITRYFAFRLLGYQNYRDDSMDQYLATAMQLINCMENTDFPEARKQQRSRQIVSSYANIENLENLENLQFSLAQTEQDFLSAMHRAKELFGQHAFRKSFDHRRRTPVNKALFDVWSVTLAELSEAQFAKLLSVRKSFFDAYKPLIDNRQNHVFTVSYTGMNSHSKSGVEGRYQVIADIFKTIGVIA